LRRLVRLTPALVVLVGAASSGQAQQLGARSSVYLADARASAAHVDDAAETLRLALQRLESHATIQAKLRQRVDLFGYHLVGSGNYLQQGRGARRQLRLEIRMQADERVSSFQQVCDGRFLWTHQDLLGKTSLTRIDLQRAENYLKQPTIPPRASVPLLTAPGGLPKLLDGLQTSFRFVALKPDELDGLPVFSLTGEWRPERLAEILPSEKSKLDAGKAIDPTQLPRQMPERVVLKLGRDDSFPYRLEYWQREVTEEKDIVAQLQPVVVMELYEVQLGATVDKRQFDYKPGDLKYTDQTKEYVRSLGIDPDAPVEAANPVKRLLR